MMKGEIIRQGAGLLVLSAQITGRVKSFPLKEYSRCFMVRRRPSPQLCTARLYRGIRTHSDTEADTPQGISYRRVPGGTPGSSDTRRPSQRHQSPLSGHPKHTAYIAPGTPHTYLKKWCNFLSKL